MRGWFGWMALRPVGAWECGGSGDDLGGSWSEIHGNIPNTQLNADEVHWGALLSEPQCSGKTEAAGHST